MLIGKKSINRVFNALLIVILFFLLFILIPACKAEAVEKKEIEEPVGEVAEELEEEATAKEEAAEEEEPGEEVPQDILDLIETADAYYKDGDYSLAVKEYRNSVIAMDESDLSERKKQELKDGININYQDAVTIVDTARMHHGNAMKLEYEKRFEEAKAELEAALVIYPKYQAAIDALASLEALMGLNS